MDLTLFRGRTYTMQYAHTDSDGAALDLSGTTVYFTVKTEEFDTTANDSTALIQKTVTTHSDPTAGLTTFTLTDADTYVTPGDYFYDLVVEDASGYALPPSLYGRCTIQGTPTNRNV